VAGDLNQVCSFVEIAGLVYRKEKESKMGEELAIIISGQARVGKDSFALMLAEELNKTQYQTFIMMAYSQELKLRCQRDFDLSYEQLWGGDKEIYDQRYPKMRGPLPFCAGNRDDGRGLEVLQERQHWTAREIMQEYGQFFREIDNDFWVKYLMRLIEDKEYTNVIITDGRHKNEIDAVCDRDGGYHIRVERENKDTVHGSDHISETALDEGYRVDFTVVNNKGLDELKQTAKDVAKFLINSEKISKKLNMKEK